ncbi:nucleolus and neural progenitor protein [Halichoeres trimaculatus]|uniref:nucleolus and neural progenitor protein n=1 Tax=Halichoeres trimaculatus TaxID=147232 RepID=UPI003D9EE5FF
MCECCVEEGGMAAELWNRVKIPIPSAVSCVRVPFSLTTDTHITNLLSENENVLKLIQSEILQTEIRVLYELLYILSNSFKCNKSFKGLQRVEQCINKLKRMKLDAALQELKQLCPNRFQRGLSIRSGECDVPSQPKLEWLCLKVLGAVELMSCTLSHCSRTFSLSKQHMKLEEFIILNVVITSMLSRLWVMFRGVLCCLSTLYDHLLILLSEVAEAQPMPFLTDFSLPADVALFLGPADAFLLTRQSAHGLKAKKRREKKKKKKTSFAVVKSQKKVDDLGVAVERGSVPEKDMKPFLRFCGDSSKGKSFQHKTQKAERTKKFKKQLKEATAVTDMEICLQEMIQWCKSERMTKRKCLFTFLLLKCQRMKCLEAAGYNVQRRIKTFRQEACWALSLQGSLPTSLQSSTAIRKNPRLRTRLHRLRSQFKSSSLRAAHKNTRMKRGGKRTELAEPMLSRENQSSQASYELTSPTTEHSSHDDIDDIFASVGL